MRDASTPPVIAAPPMEGSGTPRAAQTSPSSPRESPCVAGAYSGQKGWMLSTAVKTRPSLSASMGGTSPDDSSWSSASRAVAA